MGYCSKCGNRIREEGAFCAHCGTALTPHTQRQAVKNKRRLHCPRCKSCVLSPVVEVAGSIGTAYKIGKKSAITGADVVNRSYWVCQDCGKKFRNVDDWLEEIEENTKLAHRAAIGVCLILVFIGMICMLGGGGMRMGMAFFAAAALSYWGCRQVIHKISQIQREKAGKLRKDCFE